MLLSTLLRSLCGDVLFVVAFALNRNNSHMTGRQHHRTDGRVGWLLLLWVSFGLLVSARQLLGLTAVCAVDTGHLAALPVAALLLSC